uniref:Uncharacterized protein n=1 Tax=Arcella intermedia TaxID=1963864 RepID=A0A6B2LWQ4_9EUKA
MIPLEMFTALVLSLGRSMPRASRFLPKKMPRWRSSKVFALKSLRPLINGSKTSFPCAGITTPRNVLPSDVY